jgi:hypothetical protein
LRHGRCGVYRNQEQNDRRNEFFCASHEP